MKLLCRMLILFRAWVAGLRPGLLTIAVATGMHVYQALALLVAGEEVEGCICMSAMLALAPSLPLVSSETSLALTLLAASGLAIVVLRLRTLDHLAVVTLLLPQFTFLFAVVVEIFAAIIRGTYADGYAPRGRGWFISSDQVLFIVFTPCYLIAVFARAQWHGRVE